MDAGVLFLASAAVAAVVSGLFLLGGLWLVRQGEHERVRVEAWRTVGAPVRNAADDVVSRLFDVIVRSTPIDLSKPLPTSGFDIYDPPREVSTVWRFGRYLAAATYLDRRIAEFGDATQVQLLRFYSDYKLPLALKGNLMKARFRFQTEGQQLVGSAFLSLAEGQEIRDLTFDDFVVALESNVRPILKAAEACQQFLSFDRDVTKLDSQLVAVALGGIYLIDLVQDLGRIGKWEEFRLLLVAIVAAYNRSTAGPAIFLYRPRDLTGSDYLATYNFLPSDREWSWMRAARIRRRGAARFQRSIEAAGLRRSSGRTTVFLRWADTPGDLLRQLQPIFSY